MTLTPASLSPAYLLSLSLFKPEETISKSD